MRTCAGSLKGDRRGFTLAEVLIVVAIIAVLVSIGVVVLLNQLEKARQAVDLTNMRMAYGAAQIEWMTNGDHSNTLYYYNGNNVVTDNSHISGYGNSSKDASTFSGSLPVKVQGIPKRDGFPAYIKIKMNDDGVESMTWGGAYSGQNIQNESNFQNTSYNDRLKKDILLLDSLQDEVRNMTLGDLQKLLIDPKTGDYKAEYKSLIANASNYGGVCLALADGRITKEGSVKSSDIYFEDLFKSTGFDTNNDYIINSVKDGTNDRTNRIWVALNISENELKRGTDKNKLLSKAFTYVKSGGASTPEQLRADNRKNK